MEKYKSIYTKSSLDLSDEVTTARDESSNLQQTETSGESDEESCELPPAKRRSASLDIFSLFTNNCHESQNHSIVNGHAEVSIAALAGSEIDRYSSDIIHNPIGNDKSPCSSFDFDVLHWWNENKKKYPLLSQLAKLYLAIPASSAPSERLFSGASNTVTDKRSQIGPEVLHGVLFLKSNSDFLKYQ